jgi:glycosyltransferase involved in cell wall biosynthesis
MLNSEELTNGKAIANLTVAIATLNRPDALEVCLKTLLAGNVLPTEIIIVDQSLEDTTRQVVERCNAGQVSLVYIHHDGRGLGAAQNIAIKRARTSIIAVTDDDCEPAPDRVARIEHSFAPPNLIDALTGRVLPAGSETPGTYAVSSRESTVRVEFDRKAMPWYVGSGNNFAVKREWLESIGGTDERLGPGSPGQGGVDMDLFYRLLRAGARIRYEPELVVYHARTSKEGRMSRRIPYGYGMGACCRIWLREKDHWALRVLGHWVLLRLSRLWQGIRNRRWMLVYEELLVLAGTIGGFTAGLRLSMSNLVSGSDDSL